MTLKEWAQERAVYKFFYGDPPRPFRPPGPKSIDTVIYRGNDERSPKLPNNGIYRTCTFHLTLLDKDKRQLEIGDSVSSDIIQVKLHIKRADGANKLLFDKKIISKLFLSDKFNIDQHKYDKGWTGVTLESQPQRIEIIEEFNEFVAYFPINVSNAANQNQFNGTIYIYESKSQTFDQFVVEPHYAIIYDFFIMDGKIGEASDLWIGNMHWNPTYELPETQRPSQVKLRDWHSRNPIPFLDRQTCQWSL